MTVALLGYLFHSKYLFQLESFNEAIENISDILPNEQCATYIEQNWIPVKEMWCLLGRRFYHGDHDTNSIVKIYSNEIVTPLTNGQHMQLKVSLVLLYWLARHTCSIHSLALSKGQDG